MQKLNKIALEKIVKWNVTRAIDTTLAECMLRDSGHHELDRGVKPKLIREHVSNIMAAYQANAKPKEAEGWRDISSAPKDGSGILICEDSGFVGMGFWGKDTFGTERWLSGAAKQAAISGMFMQAIMSIEPTHWQPLPLPPTEALQQGLGECV